MSDISKQYFIAVKAVGEWKLDILAIPFGSRDSDGQWFDDRTDIKDRKFTTPLVLYQHGVKQGAQEIDEKPVELGDAVPGSLRKELDGWHFDVILDQSVERSTAVMQSAKAGKVAVSSDSISHLARLDIGGKLIQYEKNRPGRIAVWPLAGVSLWEMGNGNYQPASHQATALPAMKAIYREVGKQFPEIETSGVSQALEVRKRAQLQAQAKAKLLLKQLEKRP